MKPIKNLIFLLAILPMGVIGCGYQSKDTTKNMIIEQLNFKFNLFDNSKVEELAGAIKNQDTTKMRKILEHTPDIVNFQESKKKNTLLILSVIYNLKQETEILLHYGADPNLLNIYNQSAMFYGFSSNDAPDNCDLTIPKLLIKYGGNLNYTDLKSCETLISASISGNVEPYNCFSRTKLLLDNGADVNLWVKDQIYCSVNRALTFDKYKIAECLLIEYKAQIPKFGKKVINDEGTFTYVSFRDYILELITNSENDTDIQDSEKKALKNILNYIDEVK